jgi:nitrate/nitrite transport system permease protein
MTVNPPISRLSALQRFSQLGNLKQLLIPLAICSAVLLVIWEVLCMRPESPMPPPSRIFSQTWDPYIVKPFFDDGGTSKGLGWQILISLQRVLLGYTLAAIIGIAGGIVIGTSTFMRRGLDPIIQILRTVPPLAWLPLSLAIFKNNDPAAIFVIFITAIWPILINTAVGVQQIPQDYRNVSKVLQLSKLQFFTKVLFPSTVPYIFTGLRIGIGLAWLAIVAAEMLKADGGIGFFIWDAYNNGGDSGTSQIILAILYVGLVGLLLDRIVGWVGSWAVPQD